MVAKLRYIRHPYLILRTITRIREDRQEKKHNRLAEYDLNNQPIHVALERLIGTTQYLEELENGDFEHQMKHQFIHTYPYEYYLSLYSIVRFLKPSTVIETGVASGFSSSHILKALAENNKGHLHSIDLHYRDGVTVPKGKPLGWVIPEQLKTRWTLHLGESKKVFPKLLQRIGTVDLFLHDSRHSYVNMIAS